jgi:hypothetical protein
MTHTSNAVIKPQSGPNIDVAGGREAKAGQQMSVQMALRVLLPKIDLDANLTPGALDFGMSFRSTNL